MNEIPKELQRFCLDASILEHISDPVIVVDFAGRVLFWNLGAEQLYGLASEAIVGAPSSEAYRTEWTTGNDEQALIREIRARGTAVASVTQHLQDGRSLPVEIRAYLFRNELQEDIGLIEMYLFSVLILHPGMYLYRFGESVLCEHGIAG